MTVAHLMLADGTRFSGRPIGAAGTTIGEVVFNTGMTGYQEVLTDPSYAGQLVTMTAPQIGNTGANGEDEESQRPHLAGFIVHELSRVTSNHRSTEGLDDYLRRHGIVGIADIDTRSLTRHIRDAGAQMAAIGHEDPQTLHDRAKAAAPMEGRNLTTHVTIASPRTWEVGSGDWRIGSATPRDLHVVAIDFGIKYGILRCLVDAGCRITLVPADTPAGDVLDLKPDGVFLSNGPGDPAAVQNGIATVGDLLGRVPIFGICLGHQILALALGGKTYKLKFGHRGLNQPVKELATGRVEVTSQNHGFVVDVASLAGRCGTTHVHLNDGTCEGILHRETGAFGVQYHPEASAGPHDARYLFDRFCDAMANRAG